MRWPRRRKPRKSLAAQRIDRAIGQAVAVADTDEDGLTIAGRWDDPELGALLDAVTVPSPERVKPETPKVKPFSAEHQRRALQLLADLQDDLLRNFFATTNQETTMTTPEPLKVWESELIGAAKMLAANIGEKHRKVILPDGTRLFLLTEAELNRQTELAEQPETGSAAWLRDLADRLQQYLEDRFGPASDVQLTAPPNIRKYADEVERDERQAAADTRDRERVDKILRGQTASEWTRDGERVGPANLTFGSLPAGAREEILTNALELYRAGRDDQEADHA